MLPKRRSASRLGCMSSGVRCSCFSISSMTPRPPVWMQKCSKARMKSGRYGLPPMPKTWDTGQGRHQQEPCTSACSKV